MLPEVNYSLARCFSSRFVVAVKFSGTSHPFARTGVSCRVVAAVVACTRPMQAATRPCSCCSPVWFLVFLCLAVLIQSFTVSGLIPASISSLERRYSLESFQTGLISSLYDFSAMVTVLIYGYYGTHGHRPRLLGIGMAILASGAFIFALPQLISGKYSYVDAKDLDLCGDGLTPPVDCSNANQDMYAILCVGAILVAAGSSPLYALGPTHMDFLLDRKTLSKYLGIFYAVSALGPALGYIIASFFLAIWVDPDNTPSNIEEGSTNWVGAWWAPWYISFGVSLMAAVPLFFFTRGQRSRQHSQLSVVELEVREFADGGEKEQSEARDSKGVERSKGSSGGVEMGDLRSNSSKGLRPESKESKGLRYESKSSLGVDLKSSAGSIKSDGKSVTTVTAADGIGKSASDMDSKDEDGLEQVKEPSELFKTLRSLWGNKTYVFNTLAICSEGFAVSGFATFLSKAAQSLFALNASQAALYMGLTLIPGAAGGIYVGGLVVSRWKLTPRQCAKFCFIVATVSLPFFFGLYIGCPDYTMAGMNVRYNPDNDNNKVTGGLGNNFDNACNAGCGCSGYPYEPVCGGDISYFSPCYAGCTYSSDGSTKFNNCTCVSSSPSSVTGSELPALETELGKCSTDCGLLPIFLLVLLVIMFVTFLNNVPGTVVNLKSVSPRQRSIGTSTQQLIARLFGSVPGPLVFGAVLDSSCQLWESKCGSRGSCWEYDNADLRTKLVLMGVVPKIFSALFYFFSWRYLPESTG